jgi:hypothetical protein
VQADDIDISAAISWSSVNTLTLDAYRAIAISRPVSVGAQAGLSIKTNDGGTGGVFSMGQKGNIVFQDLSSLLTINGTAYTLVGTLPALANAIAANPNGAFALANSYDASADGVYAQSPIQTTFQGNLDGLGNTIQNLSIKSSGSSNSLGLFSFVAGAITHTRLARVDITTSKTGDLSTGALVGYSGGYLFENSVSGSIHFRGQQAVGGLVSTNGATIEDCSATVNIRGTLKGSAAGGLVEFNGGTIKESFATGSVAVGDSSWAGGLTAYDYESGIENSYALGSVTGGSKSQIGGFVGQEVRRASVFVSTSYSTGAVSGGPSSLVGGFAGKSTKQSIYTDAYWDTTTSGTSQATGKGNWRGIVGETTEELQSGLPAGFDPAIWGENANINNGLPYLLNNPPPKK